MQRAATGATHPVTWVTKKREPIWVEGGTSGRHSLCVVPGLGCGPCAVSLGEGEGLGATRLAANHVCPREAECSLSILRHSDSRGFVPELLHSSSWPLARLFSSHPRSLMLHASRGLEI